MATEVVRRVRHNKPDPRIRRLILTSADYAIFEAIDRHGPLPSSYLYEFTKHLRRDRSHLQNRLTEMYNGDGGGSYLTRPPQQFAAYEARYQHLVYDLTKRARALVAERAGAVSPPRSDPFVHRLMSACVGASFELAAPGHGLRYISSGEILDRQPGQPNSRPIRLATAAGVVIPDIVFGLHYPEVGYRFFAVECDRQTESIERRNLNQSAFARKLSAYAAALSTGSYRDAWGVPNVHVLVATTSGLHARNLLDAVRRFVPPLYQSAFAVSVAPDFGADWRVPKGQLSLALDQPWQTTSDSKSYATA